MYLVKTPFWLRAIYPKLVWRIPVDSKKIFLTFDDGPIPIVTPFVLNLLKEYNAKATFFCIGDNIRKHPDIFEQVKDEGHTIGNHTFNHLKGWSTPDEAYLKNFMRCQELVSSQYMRPPHGQIRFSQIKKLKRLYPDLEIVMWDVLSGDFDLNLSPEGCLNNIVKNVEPGSIVVFHDSLKAFDRLKYALPRALEIWSSKGFVFEAL